MDMKIAVMKVRAEACARMNIIIAQVKAAVEKKGMGMIMAMGSAADSETNYSQRGSVCRKHSNGSRKKKKTWRNT